MLASAIFDLKLAISQYDDKGWEQDHRVSIGAPWTKEPKNHDKGELDGCVPNEKTKWFSNTSADYMDNFHNNHSKRKKAKV